MLRSTILLVLAALVLASSSAYTMPLSPEVVQKLRAQGKLQEEKAFMEAALAKGINKAEYKGKVVSGFDPITGRGKKFTERQAIVLLVDFSDNVADTATYPNSHYVEMLFSEGTYPTGSMRDYYLENSYGQFGVTGSVEGYYRMPETYAYYVDGQRGFGSYPRNAQKLTEDAVLTADPYVDFSQYDNDGPDGIPNSGDDDGYVDALFVVHAGTGYESSGDPNDIHSHKWQTYTPISVDGVTVSTYSMEPDDGKIGVFAHEFGHVLGLPDLYDYGYDSAGTGWWSIMSRGSWGNGGITPVHFDAWCKSKLGFLIPTDVTSNMTGVSIPRVEDNAVSYALWTNGVYSNEYFLVENRETTMFDAYLPGSGLMIYHVDEYGSNDDQMCGAGSPHYLVAVEQADGNCDLEYYNNSGDDGDPYPGTSANDTFDSASTPDSRDYTDTDTQVAVFNIATSKVGIVADFQVATAPNVAYETSSLSEVSGNGNGMLDPGEEVDLEVTLWNRGVAVDNVSGTLSATDPDVNIVSAVASYGNMGAGGYATSSPGYQFDLDGSSTTDAIKFQLAITGDGYSDSESFYVGVSDELESLSWTHSNASAGYFDQWHLSEERNHTPGGIVSWKCGDTGTGDYTNLCDAGLVTEVLTVEAGDSLAFWHWIDAEEENSSVAWDGAIVEVSVDGGAWQHATPVGGYTHTVYPNPDSPFPANLPCFSGTFGWRQEWVDLSPYAGDVRVRFRFGSDGYVTEEGWHIDDVVFTGEPATALTGVELRPAELDLSPAYPNPFSASTEISFMVPSARSGQSVEVKVFSIDGRLVRTLVDGPLSAGSYVRSWDGTSDSGDRVASGIYFVNYSVAGAREASKLILLR